MAHIILPLNRAGLELNPQVAILYSNPASITLAHVKRCCHLPSVSRGVSFASVALEMPNWEGIESSAPLLQCPKELSLRILCQVLSPEAPSGSPVPSLSPALPPWSAAGGFLFPWISFSQNYPFACWLYLSETSPESPETRKYERPLYLFMF